MFEPADGLWLALGAGVSTAVAVDHVVWARETQKKKFYVYAGLYGALAVLCFVAPFFK